MGTNTDVPAFLFLREWIQIVLRKTIGDVNKNEMPEVFVYGLLWELKKNVLAIFIPTFPKWLRMDW